MIRTMIVDDEALIHVTLRSMIDWESRGYTVVCDCSSGAQALEYLRDFPVDLLITDIKMPGMSGLELWRRLRESAYVPVTVALSGYDEFDLVREAFRLGAYDYLLKANINRIALERLLDGLRQKVFHTPILDRRTGPGFPDTTAELAAGDYVAVMFQVQDFRETAQRFGGNLRERMEKPMLELVRQIRRLQGRSEMVPLSPDRYVLYYHVRDKGRIRDTILSVVRQIQGVWRDFMNLDTVAGVSGITPHDQLELAVRRCETLCRLTVLQDGVNVRVQWEDGGLSLEYEETAADCDGLIAALCGEDQGKLDRETEWWFSGLKKLEDREHIRRILILLARMGERLQNYGQDFLHIFPDRENYAALLSQFETRAERELWLRSVLRRVQTACTQERQAKQAGAIDRARNFMRDNFTNPELMLKTVADYVGFSEKYLSTQFTKECGCTFINYLNDLRIKRAQELLVQTDMKIYEISEAVGYSSVEHFNHMFKKKLCISPKDYRREQQ